MNPPEKPAIQKLTPSEPLVPLLEATQALAKSYGTVGRAMPHIERSPIPPHRPKKLTQRSAGHKLSVANPPALKDPRLTKQIRAAAHPDIVLFPPHPEIEQER
jgi:hypothetical protein